ncbi:MAG: exodeoxyribonuclease VII small subunit [Gemmatimonadetes bacterium]|nr:MAG: exodeoxyribonuclease VII small subunit [Gemmatimonadota bacterium]
MNTENIKLEAAFAELETIVERLEMGDTPLDDLLQQYERGIHLIAECRKQLQAAEQRVLQLTPNPDGTTSLDPFEE